MIAKRILASVLAASAACLLAPAAAHPDSLSIGINIGTPPPPPPPVIVTAPPQIVAVPGTAVYYVPDVNFNLFVYGGRYYSPHNGAWFYAATRNGPWTVVAMEAVPKAILAVPVTYYKIPPGHAKNHGGPPAAAGHGRGPKHKK